MKRDVDFKDFLNEVYLNSKKFNYSKETINDNIEYFKNCYNILEITPNKAIHDLAYYLVEIDKNEYFNRMLNTGKYTIV